MAGPAQIQLNESASNPKIKASGHQRGGFRRGAAAFISSPMQGAREYTAPAPSPARFRVNDDKCRSVGGYYSVGRLQL
jgi:hypothetical protein